MRKREKRAKHCERAYMRGAKGGGKKSKQRSWVIMCDCRWVEEGGGGELLPKYPHFLVVMMMLPSSCCKNILIVHPGKSENKL